MTITRLRFPRLLQIVFLTMVTISTSHATEVNPVNPISPFNNFNSTHPGGGNTPSLAISLPGVPSRSKSGTTVPGNSPAGNTPAANTPTPKNDDKIGELIAEKIAAEQNLAQTNGSVRNKLQNLTQRASELAMHAMGMLGIRYQRGGNTPETGLDCSGMVRYVFKQALGRDLPRSAAEISQVGQTVSQQDLQPGDLVFYNTMRRGFSHVGIYLGDNKFIHSPAAGGQVRIESMDLAYWKKRFNGARRVPE